MLLSVDAVFRALSHEGRRVLLDQLYSRRGLTLGQLAQQLPMSRQAVAKHVAILEAANLVSCHRQGREKRHYLNPVPIAEIVRRWVGKFEDARLEALTDFRDDLEDKSRRHIVSEHAPDFVYVIFIAASADAVWQGLVDTDLTRQYWKHDNVSDWTVGSPWRHVNVDGGATDIVGTVLEVDPPRRLVISWSFPQDVQDAAKVSRVTFEFVPLGPDTKLTVTHADLEAGSDMLAGVTDGWPAVCSNLKSLLETGKVLSDEQWESVSV